MVKKISDPNSIQLQKALVENSQNEHEYVCK